MMKKAGNEVGMGQMGNAYSIPVGKHEWGETERKTGVDGRIILK
jgi:hypothetical protein